MFGVSSFSLESPFESHDGAEHWPIDALRRAAELLHGGYTLDTVDVRHQRWMRCQAVCEKLGSRYYA